MPNDRGGASPATTDRAASLTAEALTELERAVLGALLLDGAKVGDVLKERDPDTLFGRLEHRDVWEGLRARYLSGQPIDSYLIADSLQKAGKGGSDLNLLKMMGESSSLNFWGDLELLVQHRLRRRVLGVARVLSGEIVENTATPEEAAGKAMVALVELMRPAEGSTRQLWSIVDDLIARAQKGEVPDSIHTGFAALDALLGDGFRRGQLVVVGARPSVGKSAILAQMALTAAKVDRRVLLFSPEMSGASLAARMLAGEIGLEPVKLRKARWMTDWKRVREDLDVWPSLPFLINDDAAVTSGKIAAIAREVKASHGLDLLLIDYLQRLSDPVGHNENRNLQLGRIVNSLATLGRQLDCAVIVASQLSRAVEQRAEKRPTLADLRDSGEIEQAADVVLMLHRPKGSTDAELSVEKQREGPTDVLKLKFTPQAVKFTSVDEKRTDAP